MRRSHVSRAAPRTKTEVKDALAADWVRIAPLGQRQDFADSIGASHVDRVSKAISGEHLPEAHTILNSLLVDYTALFNTLSLFGVVAVPVDDASIDDMASISAMLHAATEYLDRMKDGQRCPSDTAALSKLFKPLVPVMLAIIRQANGQSSTKLRSVA